MQLLNLCLLFTLTYVAAMEANPNGVVSRTCERIRLSRREIAQEIDRNIMMNGSIFGIDFDNILDKAQRMIYDYEANPEAACVAYCIKIHDLHTFDELLEVVELEKKDAYMLFSYASDLMHYRMAFELAAIAVYPLTWPNEAAFLKKNCGVSGAFLVALGAEEWETVEQMKEVTFGCLNTAVGFLLRLDNFGNVLKLMKHRPELLSLVVSRDAWLMRFKHFAKLAEMYDQFRTTYICLSAAMCEDVACVVARTMFELPQEDRRVEKMMIESDLAA